MLTEFYDKRGTENRSEGYCLKPWIFFPQHGKGYSLLHTYSLKKFRCSGDLGENIEIITEPFAHLDEIVAVYLG